MNCRILIAVFFCSLVAGFGNSAGAEASRYASPVADIRQAAVEFLDSLDAGKRAQAVFAMDDKERRAWSNLPATMFERQGISFGEMSSQQRLLAHRLLQSTLSSQGYLKTTGIMRVDDILLGGVADDPVRSKMFGHHLYWIGIFGDPAKDDAWGWQLDGHHLALNITIVGDEVSVTPTFMGSDPAMVLEGTYAGWYVLAAEDEKGRRLFGSLDERQRAMAVIPGKTPADVITGPTHGDRLGAPSGLRASELDPKQQRLLMLLLGEYLHNYEHDLAQLQMGRILQAGMDQIYFAWAGTEEGEPYYYRIHGPSVIIEFNKQYPPGQSSGAINHIHSVFREPGNDYGDDLLRKHLLESPHHRSPDAAQ